MKHAATIQDNRADHQPLDPAPHVAQFTDDEIRALCAHTAVVINALDSGTNLLCVKYEQEDIEDRFAANVDDLPTCRPLQLFESEPLVVHAIRCARGAGISDIAVLFDKEAKCAPELEKIALEQDVVAVAIDKTKERTLALEQCSFNLFDLPVGVLSAARSRLSENPAADSVMIMACDQVRLQPDHLAQLVARLQEDETADAVGSWITWLLRPPYLIARSFLEGIEDTNLCKAKTNGIDRPIPRINLLTKVFGEETIAANDAQDPSLEAFEAHKIRSARGAVSAARASQAAGGSKEAPKEKPDAADALLLEIAGDYLNQAKKRAKDNGYDSELEWATCWSQRNRADFPLLNDRKNRDTLAYLDSSATAQRPAAVLQAMEDFDKHENANIYRGAYDLSMQATFSMNDARKKLEDFIGADRRQTVYTENTTGGINLVALAWGSRNVHEGDVIVTTIVEHHSNFMPWMLLANRTGARLELVGINEDGEIDKEQYAQALTLKPKIVALSQLSNVMGIETPLESFVSQAHQAGARVLIDAAQGFPHIGIDVKKTGADWFAFSGHKIYGPLGIGGLWISPEVFEEMDPVACGGGAISHVSVDSYYLRPKVIQYELGTPAISSAIGFGAAIDYMSTLGWDNIHRHEQVLTRYLVDGLHAIEGITVWGKHDNPEGWRGLVCFSVLGMTPAAVSSFLGKLQVAIRAGGHCALPLHESMGLSGTCRASMGVYTTKEDIDALLVALNTLTYLIKNGFSDGEK